MLDDRFWTKVDKNHSSGCWLWLANCNNKGYGLFRPGGTLPKQLAHRLSFSEACGDIPKGGLILHSCDNPRCVNPAHLRMGNHKANTADMDSRGRRVSNPQRGGSNPSSLASDETVTNIRRQYVEGVAFADMMAHFSLPLSAIKEYCIGRSFGHLYGDGKHPTLAQMKVEAAKRRRNNAKITQEDATAIRAALAAGESGRSIAARYGIHFATVSDIKRGKIWP